MTEVKVKKLEWVKSNNEDWHTVSLLNYTVRRVNESVWKWQGLGGFGYEYSPQAAMAAAQSDRDHRVLSCLEMPNE